MKQIDLFVNSIYHNVGGNKKEIQELKAEMRSHLLEAVYELKIQGLSEQEAMEIAIERFGGEKELRAVVSQLFKAQRTFAKWVLYLAIVFLCLLIFNTGIYYLNTGTSGNTLSDVATDIRDILGNKEVVTPDMKQAIEERMKETNLATSVKIYNVREMKKSEDYESYKKDIFDYVIDRNITPDFEFKQRVFAPNWLNPVFSPYGNGDSKWLVTMEERYFLVHEMLFMHLSIVAYWILFSIWAVINAYHQRRLNLGWILVFILFNLLGYIVYWLTGKRRYQDEYQ
ncbi:permease prefix domain 1-containing protein [Niallia sp. BSM11]|uniref:permease prefix domain 1-containing protein n=1 Tax=Niallia sp. BSM11 TaxID=3391576 RepID=UPI003984C1D1